MKRGDYSELVMEKVLCIGDILQKNVHACRLLKYEEKEECIYFCLDGELLSSLNLDAIYRCRIYCEQEVIECTGRIKERYSNELGKIIKFQVKNGFYKINVNSVDKQKG